MAGVGACGVTVVGSAAEAFAGGEADVALVLTGSGVAEVMPDHRGGGGAAASTSSPTCEDLAYADHATPELARQIDARARAADITVIGTGVNPGFVMDRLPLTLAAACVRVDRVAVERVVDAAKRRAPLRAKVGAGLTPDEFRAGVAAGRLGHRGFAESCALIGLGLGWVLDEIKTTIDPVVADRARDPRRAGGRAAAVGGRAFAAASEFVRLDLEMSIAAPDPHDRVVIDGDPPLDVVDS